MMGDNLGVTPSIELGIPGPRSEHGFLLRAPQEEALVWDLENEVLSARRLWLPERGAWWVAASYLHAVVDIVLRSFPSVLLHGQDEDRLLSRDGIVAIQGRLLS